MVPTRSPIAALQSCQPVTVPDLLDIPGGFESAYLVIAGATIYTWKSRHAEWVDDLQTAVKLDPTCNSFAACVRTLGKRRPNVRT